MKKDIKVKIKDVTEQDIVITLPNKDKITLQYRNYEEGKASLDVLLPEPTVVNNWIGSDMSPAKKVYSSHVRLADQLCILL